MDSAMMIETSHEYCFITEMFEDGFKAREVVELCIDQEMPILQAQIYTQYHVKKHGRDDQFGITSEAARFFNEDQYDVWNRQRVEANLG